MESGQHIDTQNTQPNSTQQRNSIGGTQQPALSSQVDAGKESVKEAVKDRYETWDPEWTYVIGHQRPDTDAIASALAYAWFLQQSGVEKVRAIRAGQPVEQTRFALNRFNMQAPRLMTGVAPTFGHVARSQVTVGPHAPLAQAVTHLAGGVRVVPVVDEKQQCHGIITPLALARAASVALSASLNPFKQPCVEVAERSSVFHAQDRISDHRAALLRSDEDDFIVVDTDNRYIGVATRRRILQPPRARLVLVDHNELGQAVAGADEADIVGVLDHHRLGNPSTALPIPFVVEPVGCTCTLVAEQCQQHGFQPPAGLAGMMLSGILSDTLVFRSPTTTNRDIEAAAWLADLSNTNVESYGNELLRAAPGLTARDVEEIVDADRKTYEMGGKHVSIAQVEVTGFQELPQRRDEILDALQRQCQREGLALACVMITDVVEGLSHLLCRGENWILDAFPFARQGEGEFDLEDIVSRKKQLVPTLHAVMEEIK